MAALCLALISGVTAQQVDEDVRVRRAVVAAVQAQLGQDASVGVDIRLQKVVDGAVVSGAEPEPGARLARPARFRLLANGHPVGYVVAVVHAAVPHLRAARPVERNAAIESGDLERVVGEPGALPLEALPTSEVAVGARAVKALQAGEVLTSRNIRVPPAVRSGDAVTVRVVLEGVEATGAATALQTGEIGDVIRMINPDSRRQLRGRIVGRSQVEVKHES